MCSMLTFKCEAVGAARVGNPATANEDPFLPFGPENLKRFGKSHAGFQPEEDGVWDAVCLPKDKC